MTMDGVSCFFDTRGFIFRQSSMVSDEAPFTVLKFVTMRQEAISEPTHLLRAKSIS